ncbi:MAG: HipA domain-containing protein [Myxococcales bacterium]|nr:HipA domain-containing protein [Myxococcales bacterium]
MSTFDVLVSETRVGALEHFEDDARSVFTFDPAWLADPDRPTLGLFFEDRRPHTIEVSGPLCWFAHLLPQGPLRRAVARQAGTDEGDVFGLLAVLADDLPGAVVLRPGSSPTRRPAKASRRPPTAGRLHFSLAGAQWKLSLRSSDRGFVVPIHGEEGAWIAKFHDPRFPALPRVEGATMEWARRAGIEVPPFRLGRVEEIVDLPATIPTGDGSLYLIERFDRRPGGGRIHIEDFGQVLDRPPGDPQYRGDYEEIAAVLAAIAPNDLRSFCERLVFCALAGNTDAHLKNWSLIYSDGRTPRLAPAYDLVSTVVYQGKVDDEMALDLGHSKRFEDINETSFCRLAAVCSFDYAEIRAWVRSAAERVRTIWSEVGEELGYEADERALIERHLDRVPLGRH